MMYQSPQALHAVQCAHTHENHPPLASTCVVHDVTRLFLLILHIYWGLKEYNKGPNKRVCPTLVNTYLCKTLHLIKRERST